MHDSAPISENDTKLTSGQESLHANQEILPSEAEKERVNEIEEMSYAEAVLAGLPPEDETVQLVNLAKESGKSLDSVLEFCYQSSAEAAGSQIATDPLSGRAAEMVDEAVGDASLYQEMHRWCNPANVEAQLRRAHEARLKGLPKSGWKRKIKKRP